MPYLALGGRDQLNVADVEIWNFDRLKDSIIDTPVGERVDELLAMYRQHGRDSRMSARVRDIGVVSIGGRDFRPLSDAEFARVQEARHLLFLCCLAHNSLQCGPNAGHVMVTSENFDVVSQNFVLSSDFLSEMTGALLQIRIGGYTIAETRFTKPSYVNLPSRFATDETLLQALLHLRDDEPLLYRRITRAAALFLETYYNSHSVDFGARVLLQVAAFEVLFELPERGPRKAFKDHIESLINNLGEREYEYRFEVPAGRQVERRTLKGLWADRFYTLRNHIIHGEEVRHRDFQFLRAQHHLTISPVMFTHSVKRLIDKHFKGKQERRLFFDRVDWTVLNEADQYEPRRIGFRASTNYEARIQQWIEDGGSLDSSIV